MRNVCNDEKSSRDWNGIDGDELAQGENGLYKEQTQGPDEIEQEGPQISRAISTVPFC